MEACLSVVMPVYNEAQTIRKMAGMVLQRPCVKELIIVDDGSVDGPAICSKNWRHKSRSSG
jgi:glycosyltransferase involved in cell wall biosynthesis